MSKLSKVLAKSGSIEAEGENGEKITFELQPLLNKELMDMVGLLDKDIKRGISQMILLTLQKTEPDTTLEEVNNMPAGLSMGMANKIMEISGLGSLFEQKKSQLEQLQAKTGIGTKRSTIESLDRKLEAGEL